MTHPTFQQTLKLIQSKNPHQPEFVQAVSEVYESVAELIETREDYQKAKILERLAEADRIIQFRVSWTDDAGKVHINRGYRIQFCDAIGPYKGGLRFHPSVNLSVLKFLAFEQIFKNALTGIPMGGGKGGSDFNPKGKSDSEIMRFCQAFMTELYKYIGPHTDIPAGDIGVGGREIGYLFGQYKRLAREFTGTLTGKALEFGGSLIRPEATGYGSVYFAQNMLLHIGDSLKNKRCLISGSGNVALFTAEKIREMDGTVLSLSDSKGTLFAESGFTDAMMQQVFELKNIQRGRLSEMADVSGLQYFAGEKPWSLKCDMAFPSATQNELNLSDAKRLVENGCKVVCEGANMPTTADAVEFLQENKILFAPGKAANAGGVSVSGLEMAQNATHSHWSREEVDQKLQNIMLNIHKRCVTAGKQADGHIDYVKGANIAGFTKVADALVAQGVY